eukprot:g483.t1
MPRTPSTRSSNAAAVRTATRAPQRVPPPGPGGVGQRPPEPAGTEEEEHGSAVLSLHFMSEEEEEEPQQQAAEDATVDETGLARAVEERMPGTGNGSGGSALVAAMGTEAPAEADRIRGMAELLSPNAAVRYLRVAADAMELVHGMRIGGVLECKARELRCAGSACFWQERGGGGQRWPVESAALGASGHTRKTALSESPHGLYGGARAGKAINEEQGRGSLHLHVLLWAPDSD